MVPPLPPDEHARLQLLRALDLLDTAPEPIFDRITRLAAKTLNVPIALVSLIDENRQWFKSRIGVEITETPREHAFCAHAILQTPPLVIDNAENDERFRDNPLVTADPNVRFYAGVPIRSKGGLAIGTLCAIDTKPRMLTQEELDFLCDLAELVSKEVHMRETLMLANSQLQQSDVILQASEARFRSIFEVASVGIALVAPDGGWIDVNEALCEIVGYSAEELKQCTFQQITHPEDLAKDLALLDQLIKGDIASYQIEKRYLRKDGTPVWINLNVAKKTDARGRIEYFVAIIRNIQKRKETEESLAALHRDLEKRVEERTVEIEQALSAVRANERRINTIIETAQEAFIGVDLQSRITDWNSHAERMFGWTRQEALGRLVEELVVPERFRGAYKRAMRTFKQTGRLRLLNRRTQHVAQNRQGDEFPVEMTVGLAGTSETVFFSAFVHDISERIKVEQMKNEFVSTVSHELRTPLTSIRASLSLLAETEADELPAGMRGLVDIAHQSCERLVRLVNDVLDIEKFEAGSMSFALAPQVLSPVLDQAIESMQGYARQFGVMLANGVDPGAADLAAKINRDRMAQVLTNLLSNAIKFSPAGGKVELRLSQHRGQARIIVSDQGSGIPEEFRERIFQKFAQANATDSRQKGGTGLGLNICKSIVEAHGGRISFDSAPERGTRFYVDLPVTAKALI